MQRNIIVLFAFMVIYTKTVLIFGFSENQILDAVMLGQDCFWISSKNNFVMGIIDFLFCTILINI